MTARQPMHAIEPSILVPPSLAHLAEAPALAASLQRTVEARLRARARFPHTLLVGPADSSKRSIAAVIAAEMAAPVSFLDLVLLQSQEELHAALKDVPAGGIVVASGLDAVHPNVVRDLSRAVSQRRPVVAAPSRPQMPWEFDPALARPARAPRPYADFTLIGTAREPLEGAGRLLDWVERQLHLDRTTASEAARIRRALARCGLTLDVASCRTIAERVIASGVRTLPAVAAVAEWMQAEGLQSVSWSSIDCILPGLLKHQADPARASAGSAATVDPSATAVPADASASAAIRTDFR